MKIINGAPGIGRQLSEEEILNFLTDCRKNLQLGTLDEKNEPNIHPVWFVYQDGCIYCTTEKKSKKIQNIRASNTVYFSIDDDFLQFRGVKGKGQVTIIDNVEKNLIITKKIIQKYAGGHESKLAKEIISEVEQGVEVVLEIKPKFFSTWSFQL